MGWLLKIYLRLIGVQIRSQAQYRASLGLDILATAVSTALGFLTLALILQRFGGVAGWSLWEVALLYGLAESSFGLMDMLFSGFDPQNFGKQIRLGRFDQVLLRPVDVTVQILGSEFILRRLGRIFQGLVVLILAIHFVQVDWTPAKALYILVLMASLVCFFGGLFVVGATITFWTIQEIEIVNIFTYGGTEMISYPMSIYQDWIRNFFTYILPAIFLSYYPVLYILNKPDPLHMPWFAPFLSPFVGAGVLALGLVFWQFGIRHYQSTGT